MSTTNRTQPLNNTYVPESSPEVVRGERSPDLGAVELARGRVNTVSQAVYNLFYSVRNGLGLQVDPNSTIQRDHPEIGASAPASVYPRPNERVATYKQPPSLISPQPETPEAAHADYVAALVKEQVQDSSSPGSIGEQDPLPLSIEDYDAGRAAKIEEARHKLATVPTPDSGAHKQPDNFRLAA